MDASQSWRGSWWIAGEPDVVRLGVLYRDDMDRFTLELVGGFDIAVREPLPGRNGWSVKLETREIEMIHGEAEGKRFTLLYLNDRHTTGDLLGGNIWTQDWTANRVLMGIHLTRPDEAVFTQAHLQFDYLLHWSNRTTLSLALPMMSGKRAGPGEARRKPDVCVEAQYEELKFLLRVRSHEFTLEHHPVAGTRTLRTTEWAVFDVDPPGAVSHDALDTVSKDLQDLLTFCSYTPVASQGRSLIYEPSDVHPGSKYSNEVEVMGPQIYRAHPPATGTQLHHYLFRLDALDLPELLPRWLALKEKARLGCNILFGLRYISDGYVGTRLLGVATAAENLHRALRSARLPFEPDRFRAVKEKLRHAIADEPEPVRVFVNNRLHNAPTYHDRLLDLASIPDEAVVEELLTDREKWATMLKNSRNDLAHANERSQANADASPAFWLLEITYALLHLVLMAELGLDSGAQREALEHPQISWTRIQFRKVVEAPCRNDAGRSHLRSQ